MDSRAVVTVAEDTGVCENQDRGLAAQQQEGEGRIPSGSTNRLHSGRVQGEDHDG